MVNNFWWEINQYLTELKGYEYSGYEWHLNYKSEDTYLTEYGYPLGSTCWYVHFQVVGIRRFVCASTPKQAVIDGVEKAIQEIEEYLSKTQEHEKVGFEYETASKLLCQFQLAKTKLADLEKADVLIWNSVERNPPQAQTLVIIGFKEGATYTGFWEATTPKDSAIATIQWFFFGYTGVAPCPRFPDYWALIPIVPKLPLKLTTSPNTDISATSTTDVRLPDNSL